MTSVSLHTSKGVVTLDLDHEKAPLTVENFTHYARDGHYDGTIFHRVISGFVIQGGGFAPGMQQKPVREAIRNEADNGLRNVSGSVAMARTPDPDSATAQFFINVGDNAFLDHTAPTRDGWGYCVFGAVSAGLDVVQAISEVATSASGMHQDVPVEDVLIERVQVRD